MVVPTTVIIPAGGRSERMGRFKPLLPFGEGRLVDRAIANARAVAERVVVVTGYRGDELEAHLARRARPTGSDQSPPDRPTGSARPTSSHGPTGSDGLRVVHNEHWPLGMLSSIQRGAREVETEYFFVAPADMPRLTPDIYAALLQPLPRYAAFPEHRGRRGHPVLISAAVIPRLLAVEVEAYGSMRRFLADYPTETRSVPNDAILLDLDTIDEYRAADS